MTNIIKVVSVIVVLFGAIHQANFSSVKNAKAATCFTGVISPDCDEDPIVVRGHVHNISGAPISSVTVKLMQGGVVQDQTSTNADGEYCMGGVTSGSYVLNFTRTGYLPKNVNISVSSEVVRTDTLLTP